MDTKTWTGVTGTESLDEYPPEDEDERMVRWEMLRGDQDVLFQETVRQNTELVRQMKELRKELEVWKLGYDKIEREKEQLQTQVALLEQDRDARPSQAGKPFSIALIDGNEALFRPEFLTNGTDGGLEAALMLDMVFRDCLAEMEDDEGHTSTSGTDSSEQLSSSSIACYVYVNKQNLFDDYYPHDVQEYQWEQFCDGFNQAWPLWTVVDAGNPAKAIYNKLEEATKWFSSLPETGKVFVAGIGPSALRNIVDEGMGSKLVVLSEYTNSSWDLKQIIRKESLPTFSASRIILTAPQPSSSIAEATRLAPQEAARSASSSPIEMHRTGYAMALSPTLPKFQEAPKQTKKGKKGFTPNNGATTVHYINDKKPISQQQPKVCVFHYLGAAGGCKNGDTCKGSHLYRLTDDQLKRFENEIAATPCPMVGRYSGCRLGGCPWRHTCPSGVNCEKPACNYIHTSYATGVMLT